MNYVLCVWLYVSVSVHTCSHVFKARVCASAHTDVYGSQWWVLGGVPQEPVTLMFEVGRVSYQDLRFLIRLGWLASEPQWARLLPRAWVITMPHYHVWRFCEFWGSNWAPHACVASTLLTFPTRGDPVSFIFISGFHRFICLFVCVCMHACVHVSEVSTPP